MYKLIKFNLFLALAFILTACHNNQKSLKLDYQDFGPQAMSYKILGYDWWSWLDCHCEKEAAQYPVHVVVYANMSDDQLEQKFPIDQVNGPDIRFIQYCDAMSHLKTHIVETKQVPELNLVTDKLNKTKNQLLRHFKNQVCN